MKATELTDLNLRTIAPRRGENSGLVVDQLVLPNDIVDCQRSTAYLRGKLISLESHAPNCPADSRLYDAIVRCVSNRYLASLTVLANLPSTSSSSSSSSSGLTLASLCSPIGSTTLGELDAVSALVAIVWESSATGLSVDSREAKSPTASKTINVQ